MVRILFPGQRVPDWLFRVESTPYTTDDAPLLRVGCLSAVYAEDGAWQWRPVVGGPADLLVIRGRGDGWVVGGQSPEGCHGGVHIRPYHPLISWPVLCLVSFACAAVEVLFAKG